jgi:uncharacterized membrane protein
MAVYQTVIINFLALKSAAQDSKCMRKYFLTGLAALLPIAVTVWFVLWVVDFLTRPFMGFVTKLLSQFSFWPSEVAIRVMSQVLILVAIFVLVFALGVIARWFFFKTLLKIGDYVLRKTPLINKIYVTIKEIFDVLFAPNNTSFNQVVLVSFPHEGCYVIGLVTRDAPSTYSEQTKQDLVSVFVPTTPNPMTGYLIACPKEDMILLNMKPEAAVKYIVSCGVIQPEYVR